MKNGLPLRAAEPAPSQRPGQMNGFVNFWISLLRSMETPGCDVDLRFEHHFYGFGF